MKPVGRYSSQGDSPYGCVDVVGDGWEWTATKRGFGGEERVLRSSSWDNDANYVRSAYRNWYSPGDSNLDKGLRCVVEVTSW